MIPRRAVLAIPFAAACARPGASGFRGNAFVANQEGQAVAAVDLQVMAVARHVALDGSPSQVVAAQARPSVYALTPATGSVHEIQADSARFKMLKNSARKSRMRTPEKIATVKNAIDYIESKKKA